MYETADGGYRYAIFDINVRVGTVAPVPLQVPGGDDATTQQTICEL